MEIILYFFRSYLLFLLFVFFFFLFLLHSLLILFHINTHLFGSPKATICNSTSGCSDHISLVWLCGQRNTKFSVDIVGVLLTFAESKFPFFFWWWWMGKKCVQQKLGMRKKNFESCGSPKIVVGRGTIPEFHYFPAFFSTLQQLRVYLSQYEVY